MEADWPGPLTMIFPEERMSVPSSERLGGLDTDTIEYAKSIRIANRMMALAGIPGAAAPSAEHFQGVQVRPRTAEHVYQDMNGKIEMIFRRWCCGVSARNLLRDCRCIRLRVHDAVVDQVRSPLRGCGRRLDRWRSIRPFRVLWLPM